MLASSFSERVFIRCNGSRPEGAMPISAGDQISYIVGMWKANGVIRLLSNLDLVNLAYGTSYTVLLDF